MKVVTRVVSLLLVVTAKATGQKCASDGTCDTHERCPVWKEEGECENSKHYMEKYCPVSCADPTTFNSNDTDCEDLHLKCPVWAELGECDNNAEMVKHCAKSCNTCHLAENDKSLCNDKNESCQRWADIGECQKNPQYMHRACARSCGTCETVFHYTNQNIGAAERYQDTVRGLEDATANFGERQLVYGEEQEKAIEVIKRSIEYMGSDLVLSLPQATREGCRNNNIQCSVWASLGECEANPGFMKRMCAPACLSCDYIY